jgi:hypothetical protein
MSERDYAYNSSESHLKPLPPEDWPNIDHIKTEADAPVDGERLYEMLKAKGIDPGDTLGVDKKDQ